MVSSQNKIMSDETTATADVVVAQINHHQANNNGGFVSRLSSPFKSNSNSNALNRVGSIVFVYTSCGVRITMDVVTLSETATWVNFDCSYLKNQY